MPARIQDHRVAGLALIAPHFIVEEFRWPRSPRSGRPTRPRELKAKLARWHKDVDNAFYGWNGAWLDPKFRDWDISEYLAYIRVPVAIVQGADDQYGTMRQVEIAQEECYCPVDVTIIAGAGHSPHREAPEATLDGDRRFRQRRCSGRRGLARREAASTAGRRWPTDRPLNMKQNACFGDMGWTSSKTCIIVHVHQINQKRQGWLMAG